MRNYLLNPPGLLKCEITIHKTALAGEIAAGIHTLANMLTSKIMDKIFRLAVANVRENESSLTKSYRAELLVMTRAEFEDVVQKAALDLGYVNRYDNHITGSFDDAPLN